MNGELNVKKVKKVQKEYETKDLLKFIVFSVLGVFLFLIPVPSKGTFNLPVGIIIDFIKQILGTSLLYIATGIVLLSAAISAWASFAKPDLIVKNKTLSDLFVVSPLYFISRIIGAVIAVMVLLKVGPNFIISGDTGGTMLDLAKTLVAIAVTISYLMPFLTDFGIMEFTGIMIRKFVKPLFTVPGRSAVDLITSWLGASTAAVLLTKKQYDSGYYTGREASVIMTNFSLVSVPFCYIVASILKIESMFAPFYIITTLVGIILAMILPRIAPLSKIPDEYNPQTGKMLKEEIPEGANKFEWALNQATSRAKRQKPMDVIHEGNKMFSSIMVSLLPIVVAWGTIALICVTYTKIFTFISYPMGYYLNMLGIEEAFKVAPATLVGFIDMFIPALMLAPITVVKTKFILGALSLVQIIYVTEVGAVIVQSEVPVDFKNLAIIFLERTVIALPLITLFSMVIF
ncbi:MAG: nucleoside recognition membrane protein YjiH [Clostridium sp.]|jgi:nucleoside recognition membrane protein YjiH